MCHHPLSSAAILMPVLPRFWRESSCQLLATAKVMFSQMHVDDSLRMFTIRNPERSPAVAQVAEVMDPEAGFLLRDSVVLAVEVLECCPWCACCPLQYWQA